MQNVHSCTGETRFDQSIALCKERLVYDLKQWLLVQKQVEAPWLVGIVGPIFSAIGGRDFHVQL